MLEQFKQITHFVFETEGVLADEIITVTVNGEIQYQFNSKDEYALHHALSKGYKISFVITSNSPWQNRWRDAGVNLINKFKEQDRSPINYSTEPFPTLKNTLYMGCDFIGYLDMQIVSLPTCPSNAIPEIKQIAKYISPFGGGKGCVRDVLEKVLKLNGHWHIAGK
jgi:3-deoxy-D-manno-octulosonate 8-phosphate phosphatase (KDO 8-P phosphatase)